jgi:hypothetical protein
VPDALNHHRLGMGDTCFEGLYDRMNIVFVRRPAWPASAPRDICPRRFALPSPPTARPGLLLLAFPPASTVRYRGR